MFTCLFRPAFLTLLLSSLLVAGCSETRDAEAPEAPTPAPPPPEVEATPEPPPEPPPVEEPAGPPPLSEALIALIAGLDESSLGASNPLSGDSAAIKTGRDEYQSLCAQCHGKAGNPSAAPAAKALGVEPPDFSDPEDRVRVPDGARFAVMKNGIPGTAMQAFGAAMSDKQIWQILAYVETLSPQPPPPVTDPPE